MSENIELKNHAREIQEILNLGYMKSLKLAEDIASMSETRVVQNGGLVFPLSESYFLPLSMMSKHWILMAEDMAHPTRWIELYNIDSHGNYLRQVDADPVTMDFNLYRDEPDMELSSFENAKNMILTIPYPKSFDQVVDALVDEPKDHVVKNDVTIEIPLPHDVTGKVWMLHDIASIVEQNVDWAEFGPIIPSKLNEL